MTAPDEDVLIVGLGGNVGAERSIVARFGRARSALAQLGALRSAPLYRSAPIGPTQAPYLNTAVRIAGVTQAPGELIATLLELERLLGRNRSGEVRWGPRHIDLDVLVWGQRELDTPELIVPHPWLAERRFALAPLVSLVGEGFWVPGIGPSGALLAQVSTQDCEELGAW